MASSSMTPILTVFKWSPDGGKGMARDTRVRWALEEIGQPYEVRLVTFRQLKEPAHRARNPFGQIPAFEDDGLVLFESGAIIHYLAQTHPGLLPDRPDAQAQAVAWMFAAVSTVEPPIVEREQADFTDRGQPWYSAARLAFLDERIRIRLGELSAHLGDRDWLDGAFSAGDIMMVLVLRRTNPHLLSGYANLAAYIARAEARPAYQRAYAAQAALYSGQPPEDW
jgi:glutathione S-transferase